MSEKDYKFAVFIGRFQPFHNSHLDVVTQGLEIAEKLIIIVGSSTAARSVKNPFTFEERKMMILESLSEPLRRRVTVCGVRDYYYSQDSWLANVQAVTDRYVSPGDSVALLGSFKDSSSFYLNCFPQWDHIATLPGAVHGTELRDKLYRDSMNINNHIITDWEGKLSVPPQTDWLIHWVSSPVGLFLWRFTKTKEFADLAKEWQYNNEYKKSWESAPFPPTFTTVDTVVTCSGHVLVVKRKFNPGKGLYALPGGFVKQTETLLTGAIRELKEETRIRINPNNLQSYIADSHVFDHPERSLRGRTITYVYYLPLLEGPLPEVKGNDDASEAFWMPLWDVQKYEDKFFEDHAHIINYFVGGHHAV